jgi:SARP family transcriptional regulator, regulator of embCAB operon
LPKRWQRVAVTLRSNVRVYLTGRMTLETDERLVEQGAFVGQQGRAAFALLTLERGRPVSRSECVTALWSDEVPPAHDVALNAVMSKLRGVLTGAGFPPSVLTSGSGCYEMRLPAETWVDFEAAAEAIHEAEAALKVGDPARAYGPSAVAHHIARRPFLAGDASRWAEARRDKLHHILMRALECRAQVYLWNSEFSLAIEAAQDAVREEPFRETAHQLLMRAYAASGNTAEALQAYERCRRVIADELGVDPSPAMKALHMTLLKSV